MDAPPIQFARTADSVNIAYWTLGDGPPLIWINDSNCNHAELEWGSEWHRRWYQALSAHHLLVKFDARGTGLSDRDIDDFTLPARVSDLSAVVEALGLERFTLVGALTHAGSVAMQYALNQPARVDKLILIDCFAAVGEFYDIPLAQGMGKLTTRSWDTFAQAASRNAFGWDSPIAAQYADVLRVSMEPEAAVKLHLSAASIDLSAALADLTVPTLVIAHADYPFPPPEASRKLAVLIPSAWVGGSGNWSDASNWDPAVVPNNGADTYAVSIDDGDSGTASEVTANGNFTIDSLAIDSGDSLDIASGRNLVVVGGPLTNNGEIRLDHISSTGSTQIFVEGDTTIGGTGNLTFLTNTFANQVLGTGLDPRLFNGAGHTIRGTAVRRSGVE